MAISVVKTQSGAAPQTSPISYTVSGNGNNVLLAIGDNGANPTPSGLGATWTSLVSKSGAVNTNTIWFGTNCTAGAGSIALSGTLTDCVYALLEVSGESSSTTPDATNSGTFSSGTSQVASITTATPNDLVFIVVGLVTAPSGKPSSPWTNLPATDQNYLNSAYQIVTTATTYSATWTTGTIFASYPWVAVAIAPLAAPSYVPPPAHRSFTPIGASLRAVAFPNVPWHRKKGLLLPGFAEKRLVLAGA